MIIGSHPMKYESPAKALWMPWEISRCIPNPLTLLGGVLVPALGGRRPLRRGRWFLGRPCRRQQARNSLPFSTPPPFLRRRMHQQAGYSPHAQRRWPVVSSFHREICIETSKRHAGRAWCHLRVLSICHAIPAFILKPTFRHLQERRHGRHLHANTACGQLFGALVERASDNAR